VKRTPRNILRHEIIGLRARVAESRNPYQVGLEGKIIDETMKTVVLLTSSGERKRVLKNDVKLLLQLPDRTLVLVDGKELVGRPEDRLKKRVRTW
jgi:ribonuclease P protein subunit POP4